MIRTRVFGGLYWGLPILGNYHLRLKAKGQQYCNPVRFIASSVLFGL